ncbi:MAG: aminodeoxychorismate/anthranilate synthase component II [Zetaproteobacteria bacterium]|nr:aminodeoxychorismate/anthranilate synthase component II [Zetaproteobacteria bacterium]
MILLVDHHDSYTYNLVHALAQLGAPLCVRTPEQLADGAEAHIPFSALVLSPGPGKPEDAHVARRLVHQYRATTPILGVCLGHQVIAHSLGATVTGLSQPIHGHVATIQHNGQGLFAGVPAHFHAMRYHSLHVTSLSDQLCATAWAGDCVMAITSPTTPWVCGVQFHPESFASEQCTPILRNFLAMRAQPTSPPSANHAVATLSATY